MAVKGAKPGEQRNDIFRETIVWDIVPEKTALLVIDMTRCFAEEAGLFFVPEAKTKIPTINSVVDASRAQGIQIVWVVRHPYRKDGLDMAQEKDFVPALVGNPAGYCEDGWGVELHPEMHFQDTDLLVPKNRFSAFISGSSNLDRILRYRGIDTVMIVGVATNVCCGTTARDAAMLDYKVIFIDDANASFGEQTEGGYGPGMVHEAELLTLRSLFAMVCTVDEIIETLDELENK